MSPSKDPKGVFFGRGNAGLATVVGETARFTPYAANLLFADLAAKRRMNILSQQLAQKALKPLDFGRFHIKVGQDFLNNTIKQYSNGELSIGDIRERALTYKSLSDASKAIEKFYDQAIKTFDDDSYLNKQEAVKRLNTYIFSDINNTEDVIRAAEKLSDPQNIVMQYGDIGSLYNVPKITKDIIDKQFDPLEFSSIDEGKWKRLKPGLLGRTDEIVSRKLHIFADVNNDGDIVVKSPEELLRSGVVEVFASNPIIDSSVRENIAKKGIDVTPENYAGELARLLEPYVSGQVKALKKTQTARYHVSGGGGGSSSSNREQAALLADKLDALFNVGKLNDPKRLTSIAGASTEIKEGDSVRKIEYSPIFVGTDRKDGDKQLMGVAYNPDDEALMIVYHNKIKDSDEWTRFSLHQLRKYLSSKEFNAVVDELNKRGKINQGDYDPLYNPNLKF